MTATAQPQVCHIWARCQVSHPAPVIACVATAHDILSSATTAQNVSADFFMMLFFFFYWTPTWLSTPCADPCCGVSWHVLVNQIMFIMYTSRDFRKPISSTTFCTLSCSLIYESLWGTTLQLICISFSLFLPAFCYRKHIHITRGPCLLETAANKVCYSFVAMHTIWTQNPGDDQFKPPLPPLEMLQWKSANLIQTEAAQEPNKDSNGELELDALYDHSTLTVLPLFT